MKAIVTLLIILVPVWFFGYRSDAAAMGIALVAGAIAAAFLHLDRFVRFKGAGFEAELKKAVDEAYATVKQVRALVSPMISANIQAMLWSNRIRGMDARDEQAYLDKFKVIADQLGVGDDSEIARAKELFVRYRTWDHLSLFERSAHTGNRIPEDAYRKLMQLIHERIESNQFASRAEVEGIIGINIDGLDEELRDMFADYEYYRDNKRLRREEALSREH